MLLSRANLHIIGAAGMGEKSVLFLDEDGTTVAADKHCLIAVEPCPMNEAAFGAPDVYGASPPPEGVALNPELVVKTLRALPLKPKKAIHKVAVMTRCDHYVEMAATDGIRVHREAAPPARVLMPDYRGLVSGLSEGRSRVCVNLRQFKRLLTVMEKCCEGDDKQPIFLEIGGPEEPLVVRADAYRSRQRLVALAMPMRALKWLERNVWERGLLGRKKKGRVVK